MLKEAKRPKRCKLCADSRRAAIDRFLQSGTSYKQFQEKFGHDTAPIYTWSRHRTHVAEEVEAGSSDLASVVDVSHLRKINRKLITLAIRSERQGRVTNALTAYAAVSKNLELLAKFAKDPDQDAQAALELPKSKQEVYDFVRTTIASIATEDADFRRWLISLAGDSERVLSETSSAHRIVADKDYREQVRALLIEADNRCAPQAPYYETIPGAFPPSGFAPSVRLDEPEESEGQP
jgi:hypothetical protein